MTTSSWTSAVSGDWSTAASWSPAGPANAATADAVIAVAGAYTVTIAAGESFLVDSLTFDPATSGVLALNGKLTLGGTLAELTESSGTINLAGTLAGGTLTLNGGLLNDAGAGVITSAINLNGGTVAIASGLMLTLPGAVTWAGGDVAG
jgi:fibronectin-binding autotransporter adhesin